MSAVVYKPMHPVSFLSNKFEKVCWDLYHAKNDRAKKEEIYRSINFVRPDGNIFDLNMRFLEKDGVVYQTNSGVYGAEHLPNLSLFYKFHFHDFWLSMLKPEELTMNEHDAIECMLDGRTINTRFFDLFRVNKERSSFKTSSVYKLYKEGEIGTPPLQQLIENDDLVEIHVGHIYYSDTENYRDAARKSITTQRKEIASQMVVPHWAKKDS